MSSLVFDEIEISGFLSFPPNRPQKINLNTGKVTTILGENLDVGDGERNGAGKSGCVDALLFLYYGKTPRISNQGLLNYVERGPLLVTGNARRDGTAFRVERGENPSLLRLFEKPVDDPRDFRHKDGGRFVFETTKSSKPETTKRIAELLGFDLKLSDVLITSNPSDRSCFFLKNEDDQRTIVERIFGFTVFSEKANRLRELRKEESKRLVSLESAMAATKQANDRVLTQIASLQEKSDQWEAEQARMSKLYSEGIAEYEGIDFEHEFAVLRERENYREHLGQLTSELEGHKEAYDAVLQKQSKWSSEHLHQMAALADSIDRMRKIDATAEIEFIKRRSDTEQEIEQITAEMRAADRERQPYVHAIETAAVQKSRLAKQITVLELQIIQLNESKCPTCGQDWADTQDHVVEVIKQLDVTQAELARTETEINEFRTKIKQIDNKADRLEIRKRGLQEILDAIPETTFQTVEEAMRASSSLQEIVNKLESLQESKNPHDGVVEMLADRVATVETALDNIRGQIANLPTTRYRSLTEAQSNAQRLENSRQKLEALKGEQNPYLETIDELNAHALHPIDEREIEQLRYHVEHMTLLISLLADRDSPIRKAILAEWLPELNSRVNQYLDTLELPHRVEFDQNMSASFRLNGNCLGFGNLSTGQRLRVWLATNIAFRDIFELINYKINLFFVDEVLDKGMSPRGAEVSYGLLQRMAEQDRSVFLITHRETLVEMADHTLTISLENGLSTIH